MSTSTTTVTHEQHPSTLFDLSGLDHQGAQLARDARILRKYRVLRLVAEGGMGRVYEVERRSDRRRLALKVLHHELSSNERSRQHILREAHALAVASNPLVVELIEYGETTSGLPYLALEWLPGKSLHAVLVDEGPLSMPRVARLFGGFLDALELVHTRGIVHADLKPENIVIVRNDDGDEEPRLVDFGVASIDREHCARAGEVYGTPGYLAPEVIRGGSPTIASDVYAAGIVLFEMLTGCTPFLPGSLAELLRQQTEHELPRPSQYRLAGASRLDAVVARALGRTPGERYADVAELRAAFRAALAPRVGVRTRHNVPARSSSPARATSMGAGMAIAAVG